MKIESEVWMAKMFALAFTFCLAGMLLALIKRTIREKVGKWLAAEWHLVVVPILFLIPYGLITVSAVAAHPEIKNPLTNFLWVGAYFIAPILVLIWSGRVAPNKEGSALLHLGLVLMLWLPIELGLVQKGIQFGEKGFKYPLVAFSAIVFAMLTFTGWRRFDIGCDWKTKKRDWLWAAGVYLAFYIIILIPAWFAGFVEHFGVNYKILREQTGFWTALPTWLFVVVAYLTLACGMFFAPGFAEELIFRGLIQNRLTQKFGNAWGLILASAIFGFAHINNKVGKFDVPNWHYVGFATVAGIGYGLVFLKTRSLVVGAVLHSLVDTTWLVFFKDGGR